MSTMTTTTSSRESCCTLHVILIAHPDDESMFFIPTIHELSADDPNTNNIVGLICLTTGNYDGLGPTRSQELYDTCTQRLNIPHVILIDTETEDGDQETRRIRDHPHQAWPLPKVSLVIYRALLQLISTLSSSTSTSTSTSSTSQGDCGTNHHMDDKGTTIKNNDMDYSQFVSHIQNTNANIHKICVYTFDKYGVSGHINHRDTYLGFRNLYLTLQLQQQQQLKGNSTRKLEFEGYELYTLHNPLQKYFPIYHWWILFVTLLWGTNATATFRNPTTKNPNSCLYFYCYQPFQWNWKAMSNHKSQFVWYRRLFVIFSAYTYVNQYYPIMNTKHDNVVVSSPHTKKDNHTTESVVR